MCDRVTTDLDLKTTSMCDAVSVFRHETTWDDGEILVHDYCRSHSIDQRGVDAELWGLMRAVYTAITTIELSDDDVVSDVTASLTEPPTSDAAEADWAEMSA